ncbi:hypothetical protein [Streptomyces sp. NBC_01190]|uniref:hypothetical protein n=1 Tax=Streptomyces sp. NBC_01190 TaxID=2903767 RepID=UPI00386A5D10|nr:hypothetical protein OG519_24175 [Streptomyces sp. NBC_01190]
MATTVNALRRWLLDHPQLRTGPHTGGVLGVSGGAAAESYVYPEIAGYYLTWLAFADLLDPAASRTTGERRDLTVAWLAGQSDTAGGPPTRTYLAPGPPAADDWRNDALFAFDLGMVFRGIAAPGRPTDGGRRARPAHDPGPVRDRVAALLADLRDTDGSWLAARPFPSAPPLPERWSTLPGPHLLKAAGGVLALHDGDDDPRLRQAAVATLARHAPPLKRDLPAMSHPALYAVEGLLQAESAGHTEYHEELTSAYHRLAGALVDGVPHEYAGRPGSRVRSDVIAQLLRAGSVLAGRGELDAAAAAQLPLLAGLLAERVAPDGSLPFDTAAASGTALQANTWCAMFAHQALVFFDRVAGGEPVPDQWVRLLV